MKRTKAPEQEPKQVDAIIFSDIHLTETTPICRTDNYIQAQKNKLNFISDLQLEHQCPVLCAGDIFNGWKPSPWLISFALKYLPDELIAIPGQHDLQQHSLELIENSGFNALMEAGKIQYENGWTHKSPYDFDALLIPFGVSIPEMRSDPIKAKREVLILHQLTWQKLPFPGADPEGNARKLLKTNPDFDLIITGDNHQAFTEEYKGRLLVNPGSMLRKTADQIDFKPRVYLWNAESNSVSIKYLPIENGAVTRIHLDIEEEREHRLDSFIELIESEDFEVGVDFEKNMKRTLKRSKVDKSITSKVLEALDA